MQEAEPDPKPLSKEVGAELLKLALAQAQSGWAAWDSLDRKLTAVFSQAVTLAVAVSGAVGAALRGRTEIPPYLALGAVVTGAFLVVAGLVALWGMRPRRVTPYGARPAWADTRALRAAEPPDGMLLLAWGQSDVWELNERNMKPVARSLLAAQVLLVGAAPLGAVAAFLMATGQN